MDILNIYLFIFASLFMLGLFLIIVGGLDDADDISGYWWVVNTSKLLRPIFVWPFRILGFVFLTILWHPMAIFVIGCMASFYIVKIILYPLHLLFMNKDNRHLNFKEYLGI